MTLLENKPTNMLGVVRTAACRLGTTSQLSTVQKAGFFTYGPPRVRQSLPAKVATFTVMAAVMSTPMFICLKMVPIWKTAPRDE